MSRLFSQTLRDAPSEAEVVSHQLLLRAGYIRQLAAGIFSYLPLARRAMDKIEAVMREEMNAIGGQEIQMPVVQPADIWKETQRWYQIDAEMGRFQDRNGRDMALAMTHEEVVADLARKEIRSYRQLPQLIYHLQTKWRDDPRPRAGLIRVREFTMKDSYSLDADWDGLDRQYRAHYRAYFRIFGRCGLDVIAVKADGGMMGGPEAHEFMALIPIGEDTLLLCDACGYKANRQAAMIQKETPLSEPQLAVEKVATPGCKTIDDLANFLAIPKSRTAKAVFMTAEIQDVDGWKDRLVFAVVRGDMEVNETKLGNAVKARSMRPATEEEIKAAGAVPGYASPLGLKGVLVVVDDLIQASPNLVSGANEAGYHLLNVNYGRDFNADKVVDLVAARDGDACPICGGSLRMVRGVEVGNIFKLGTRYSDALGCHYLDAQGQPRPIIMGSYGIGVERLLACVAELHNDEHGLILPISIAPYQVHLVVLVGKADPTDGLYPPTSEIADRLYMELSQAGIEVLYDDRLESPGIKFNDADLIGLPIRLTVSERAKKAGGVEFKRRDQPDREIIPEQDVLARLQVEIKSLYDQIEERVRQVLADIEAT